MHVVLISHTAEPTSGWGTMTYNHALHLYKRGVSFELLLPKNASRIQAPYASCIRYVLPDLPLSFGSMKNFLKIALLWKKNNLSLAKTDIVHSLGDFPYAIWGWYLAKKIKSPFIFTAHGTYAVSPFTKFPDRPLMCLAYKGAAAIIAVSNFTAQRMREVSGYKRDIKVVNNPVSPPVGEQAPCHSVAPSYGQSEKQGERIILSIGPLKPRKGIDILVKALPQVVREVPSAKLVVVAAYGNEESYRHLANSLGVEKRLQILKGVSSSQLAALFGRCELFALTPRYIKHQFEGYGLVYLEAGLYKKPVVGSISGGVPDAVQQGETGLLVPENDVSATADAIIKLLKDEPLRCKLGEGNYKLAQERSWDNYITKIIKIYDNICC